MIHELKTHTEYYDKIVSGQKKFEVRKNDRNYQPGDTLILYGYFPELGQYSGECMEVKVDYVLYGGKFGIEEGYCVMSISPI